ncbi:MAG TPA: TIGR00725 family protein [Acidimicrobiales bacterium]|nr:TIGR00725 family protein [Acidimicrobiales bacterium]
MTAKARRRFIGVVGPGDTGALPDGQAVEAVAEEVGRRLARAGAVVVCGGLGGVMAAACRGAAGVGGVTVGLLPGDDRSAANEWVGVPVATGLGEGRNVLVVRTSDALVAVGGAYGTLSEVALALKAGKVVAGLGTWDLVRPDGSRDDGVIAVGSAAEAVEVVLHGQA